MRRRVRFKDSTGSENQLHSSSMWHAGWCSPSSARARGLRRCWRKTRTCEIRKSRFGSWPHTCTSVREHLASSQNHSDLRNLRRGLRLAHHLHDRRPHGPHRHTVLWPGDARRSAGALPGTRPRLAARRPARRPARLDRPDLAAHAEGPGGSCYGSRRADRLSAIRSLRRCDRPRPLHESMHMFEVLVGRLFDAIEIFRNATAALSWLMLRPKARTLTTQ